ncbi:MAG: nucleotidyltransferase [Pirellulales bacterium]
MIPLLPELVRIAGVFDAEGIPYAVIGGIAVRALGVPRPTYDLDFTIVNDDLDRILTVLETNYEVPETYRRGWLDRVSGMPLFKIKLRKNLEAIDIDIFVADTSFQQSMLARRQLVDYEGFRFWCAAAEDVILLKLIANRSRDLGDVEDVLFMQGLLDVEYMRRWARELEVEPLLLNALRKYDAYLPLIDPV